MCQTLSFPDRRADVETMRDLRVVLPSLDALVWKDYVTDAFRAGLDDDDCLCHVDIVATLNGAFPGILLRDVGYGIEVVAEAREDGRPHRVQRRRTRGWTAPLGTVCVTRPSRWGNPFRVGDPMQDAHPAPTLFPGVTELVHDGPVMTAADAVDCFRALALIRRAMEPEWLEPLRGKNLACYCPLHDATGAPVPCHADVLLELANADA